MKYLERWPFFSALIISLLVCLFIYSILIKSSTDTTIVSGNEASPILVDKNKTKKSPKVAKVKEILPATKSSQVDEKKPPPNFAAITDTKKKKRLFFEFIYTHIKPINQSILKNRKKLIRINKQASLSDDDQEFINKLAYTYRVISEQEDTKTQAQVIDELLIKVDVIPPALVLAQAANESAWGTSRFATKANNYFGIWCFKKGCGLAPLKREKNKTNQVRLFPTPRDSILYYTKLINNSRTYQKLRNIRSAMRQNGEPISVEPLLAGLLKYSERGKAYTKELLSMIRHNQLEKKYPLVNQ